ncbi:MAG: tRNA (adenosine(37)-N6)-dimethylallyltransferase MiaA [Clostridia bacterium]|nr:tRNA (adenosine(37)-N6)-dimethylallyltransferase MiaA [Clostridia bacterium]
MKKPLVVAVVGPTASGKTALAIEIAKKFGGEIVSADSMQIYKKMQIATAKPTEYELSQVKHHLIGYVGCDEEYSVAMYKNDAVRTIDEIISEGKLPVVCGGTGLYIDTLIKNTTFLEYEKNEIRSELEKLTDEKGVEFVLSKLREIDPETAARLHKNDRKRIIRALEVYETTGMTISDQEKFSHNEESKYDWCVIGLTCENRQVLYERINHRVDIMLEQGLLDEARDFFNNSCSATAKQAIGYKELKPYLDGVVTLNEAVEKLKMETRRYAKRQLTWFRRNKDIHWLCIDNTDKKVLTDMSVEIINKHLGD